MGNSAVLVLNQNYQPLNVCNARRAFVLVDRGKAEVLEHSEGGGIRTPSRVFHLPSVIRMIYLIKRPRPKMRLSRREIFQRDRYTCQYCGRQTRDLTLDHILPRHRGGRHPVQPILMVTVLDRHRDGRSEGLAAANTARQRYPVRFDLHPPAAPVAALSAREIVVDFVGKKRHSRRNSLDDCRQPGAVGLARCEPP